MQKIAEGRTAEIFTYKPGRILKLYRDGFPQEAVRYEYEINRLVVQLGISAPEVYERIEFEGRQGIVYERIEGTTLLHLAAAAQSPEELYRIILSFAGLHYSIHSSEPEAVEIQTSAASIMRQKHALAGNICNAPLLSAKEKEQIITYMEDLPEGSRLCHGDFHPENVIRGARTRVIDWMTGMTGNPAGDVARTLLLLRCGTLPEEAPVAAAQALDRLRNIWREAYLQEYLTLSGLQVQDIERWIVPVAAARLTEWISGEEKAALVQIIRERLS
ncbi:phosphotransferase family protein [Paenibacillus sp. CN-4]|uniref:phosphotransferase family protein n=1 Tax=Paenibacillus nanchangensis TaxID=3348343 RepID=UPI00397C310D